ncbi:MAG: Crp/Fnr family transcriptional regulator [Planctomycetaceae bacterium]
MNDKFWYLKHCDLFNQLSSDELSRLESRARFKSFKKGDLVYLPTDRNDSIILLTSGRVKIYHITSEGKQALLAFIDPGEMFGELSLFESGQREEFAEAMETSGLVLIPGEEVHHLMETHPDVSLNVTRMMGLRRKRVERRLKSLLFRSNRERLIHLLIELVEKYGQPETDGLVIGLKLSHQDLAGIIGSTRETVTVILGELQSEGLIVMKRRRIILKNLTTLAASIDMSPPNIPKNNPPVNPVFQQSR